jgi:hypothetical protein
MFKRKIICLSIFVAAFFTTTAIANETSYSIIVDAGSSGSRLHIFQNNTQTTLPNIAEIFSENVATPLASFASHPQDAGHSLKPILDDALNYFTNNHITSHPIKIHVLGTAGMRLLDKRTQREIYRNVKSYIRTYYSSQLVINETRTITGKEEGLFDWLDINYLSNHFANQTDTVGSLDVGGASTQIAFATYDTSKAIDETRITINNKNYIVFIKSFLGLGQDQARDCMNTSSLAGACYPLNYTLNEKIPGNYSLLTCTSNYGEVISGYHVNNEILPIDPAQKFIAYSGAFYAFNFFDADKTPNQSFFESQITQVCAKTWEQMKSDYLTTSETYLSTECANATYIDDLFFNYYHLQNGQLIVLKEINSKKIDWALGAMLYILIIP